MFLNKQQLAISTDNIQKTAVDDSLPSESGGGLSYCTYNTVCQYPKNESNVRNKYSSCSEICIRIKINNISVLWTCVKQLQLPPAKKETVSFLSFSLTYLMAHLVFLLVLQSLDTKLFFTGVRRFSTQFPWAPSSLAIKLQLIHSNQWIRFWIHSHSLWKQQKS